MTTITRLSATLALVTAVSFAAHAQTTLDVRLTDGRPQAVDLSTLTRHRVSAEDHGQKALFEGVLLSDVLAKAGVEFGAKLRGPAISRYATVVARDGYRVTFSLGELDPEFTNLGVIVADMRDGKPLSAEEGPRRLVVPGDKHGSRWARQVASIVVAEPPKAP